MVIDGVTVIDVPFPAEVPPHETVYHCQVAPVPKLPPDKVNVEGTPEQTATGFAVAEDAATDGVLRVTVTLAHVVVLQSPTAPT